MHMYVYTHIHRCTCTQPYTCRMHAFFDLDGASSDIDSHIFKHRWSHIHTCTYTYSHTHVLMEVYTHIHICTSTHTYTHRMHAFFDLDDASSDIDSLQASPDLSPHMPDHIAPPPPLAPRSPHSTPNGASAHNKNMMSNVHTPQQQQQQQVEWCV